MAGKVLVNVLKGAFSVLGPIIEMASPGIRKLVQDSMYELYRKAKATPNTMDDVLVDLLFAMFGLEAKDVPAEK